MSPPKNGPAEAVSVSAFDGGWRWQARGASSTLEGAAQSHASAWKTATFAAGALEAFSRAGRRRF